VEQRTDDIRHDGLHDTSCSTLARTVPG